MNPCPVTVVQQWCGDDGVLDRTWLEPMGLYWNVDEEGRETA